jgi:hypothetical protein
VFLFTVLLVVLQVAGAQLSPRVIARGLRNQRTRLCLGLFVFTFLFGVAVGGRLESAVGQLRLCPVILLNLASIAAFLYLVAYLGDYLRPISVLTGRPRRRGRDRPGLSAPAQRFPSTQRTRRPSCRAGRRGWSSTRATRASCAHSTRTASPPSPAGGIA